MAHSNNDFRVLIIGSDINAYHMARSYHEHYGEKAHLLAKSPMAFTKHSTILDIEYDQDLWDEEVFVRRINEFANSAENMPVLAISSNETYARFLVQNAERLANNIVFNYPRIEIFDNLIMKNKFYNAYRDLIDIPRTIIYSCADQSSFDDLDLNFDYPVIVKPSNVIEYNHKKTPEMYKIYKLYSEPEVRAALAAIEAIGYVDDVLIQEFIPGDDSALFDAVLYCDQNRRATLAAFAQIGLQEHARGMVGNAAVLINGYNENDDTEAILAKIIEFAEAIGYQGLAEFDMKYDYRDKRYKVLEINARQGRCSYYVTAAGHNLVKCLVDDLIYNKRQDLIIADQRQLLSFVPRAIAKRYIKNEAFKREALRMWSQARNRNPLTYSKDSSLKRRLILAKKAVDYFREYRQGDWQQ
ncbi:MAG: carboxylate--amine ligase [Coriobacteriia bacterium]|nr:carboxylate--amine ligase [Coriobacteriia bacterium]